jgi:cytochrome c oxidase assembly protein subunit 15
VAVNFAHRVGATLVTIAVVSMVVRLRHFEVSHPLRIVSNLLLLAVSAQIMLGGYTVWSGKQPHITSLHVMTGALTLALSVILALTARTVAWRSAKQPVAVLTEVAA